MRRLRLRDWALGMLLGLSGLVGCTGTLVETNPGGDDDDDPPDAGSGGVTAKQMFDDGVSPLLAAQCASCHAGTAPGAGGAPPFLGAGAAAFYNALMGSATYVNLNNPASSLLVTKGEHFSGAGPAFSPADRATIQSWLEKEALEGQEPPGADAGSLGSIAEIEIDKFGNCMRIEDWEASGIALVADQNTTGGRCYACHESGTGGAFFSQDSTLMFQQTKTRPYILKLAFPERNVDGTFSDVVLIKRFEDKGLDPGHPEYLLADALVQSVQEFFDLTYAHYLANDCPP